MVWKNILTYHWGDFDSILNGIAVCNDFATYLLEFLRLFWSGILVTSLTLVTSTSDAIRLKVLVRSLTLIFSFSNSFSLSSLIEAFLELFVDEAIETEDDIDGEASFVFLCGKGGGMTGGSWLPKSSACLELDRDKSLDMTELDLDMFRTGTGGA